MTEPDAQAPASIKELENALTAALRQFWWIHDARWYQGVKNRFGQEVANEINAEALNFVGRRVGAWYEERYGMPEGDAVRQLAVAIENLTKVMTSEKQMRSHVENETEESVDTVITDFFALKMLKAARSLEGYSCPCLDMRGGWFDGLGVEVKDCNVECMRTGGTVCRFRTTTL